MQSDSIDKLAQALCKVQSEIRGYKEDSNNPFFKSKYGDLTSVWAAIRESVTANDLCVSQLMEQASEPGAICVKTLMMHSSGQWISGVLELVPDKKGPQAAGSCITYARRYSLASIVGVSPVDDDAEDATDRSQKPPKSVSKKKSKPSQKDTVSTVQNDNTVQDKGPSPKDRYADIRKRFVAKKGDMAEFQLIDEETRCWSTGHKALDALELLLMANTQHKIAAFDLTAILEKNMGAPVEAIEQGVDAAIHHSQKTDEAKRETTITEEDVPF